MQKILSCKFLICIIILFTSCSTKNLIQIGQLKNLNVIGFDENALLCQAELEIDNSYFLPFKLVAAELNIYASKQILGIIEIINPLRVKAHSSKTYKIDFKLKLSDTRIGISSLIQKFFGRGVEYRVIGKIHAHSFLVWKDIPVDIPLFAQ